MIDIIYTIDIWLTWTLVAIQMVLSSIIAKTILAMERLFTFMNQFMCFQLIGITKLASTVCIIAFVWFFACMRSGMPPQVGNLNKFFLAVGTFKRFLASMQPDMCF